MKNSLERAGIKLKSDEELSGGRLQSGRGESTGARQSNSRQGAGSDPQKERRQRMVEQMKASAAARSKASSEVAASTGKQDTGAKVTTSQTSQQDSLQRDIKAASQKAAEMREGTFKAMAEQSVRDKARYAEMKQKLEASKAKQQAVLDAMNQKNKAASASFFAPLATANSEKTSHACGKPHPCQGHCGRTIPCPRTSECWVRAVHWTCDACLRESSRSSNEQISSRSGNVGEDRESDAHKGNESKKKKPSGFAEWQARIKKLSAKSEKASIAILENGLQTLKDLRSAIPSDDSLSGSERSTLNSQIASALRAKESEMKEMEEVFAEMAKIDSANEDTAAASSQEP